MNKKGTEVDSKTKSRATHAIKNLHSYLERVSSLTGKRPAYVYIDANDYSAIEECGRLNEAGVELRSIAPVA